MRIPKSCELLVIQDFVEYLMTYNISKNYIWFEKGFWENVFKIVFSSLFTFCVEKRILKQKGFWKGISTRIK